MLSVRILASLSLISVLSACQEDPNEAANRLFVEASALVQKAKDTSQETAEGSTARVALLKDALQKLETIPSDYPQSNLAVQLITEGGVGGLSVSSLRSIVAEAESDALCFSDFAECVDNFSSKIIASLKPEGGLDLAFSASAYASFLAKQGKNEEAYSIAMMIKDQPMELVEALFASRWTAAASEIQSLLPLVYEDFLYYRIPTMTESAISIGDRELITALKDNWISLGDDRHNSYTSVSAYTAAASLSEKLVVGSGKQYLDKAFEVFKNERVPYHDVLFEFAEISIALGQSGYSEEVRAFIASETEGGPYGICLLHLSGKTSEVKEAFIKMADKAVERTMSENIDYDQSYAALYATPVANNLVFMQQECGVSIDFAIAEPYLTREEAVLGSFIPDHVNPNVFVAYATVAMARNDLGKAKEYIVESFETYLSGGEQERSGVSISSALSTAEILISR